MVVVRPEDGLCRPFIRQRDLQAIAAEPQSSVKVLRQMACKPGSVLRPKTDGWPFLWDDSCLPPHATYPDGYPETDYVPSLFGLAPGGACQAVSVARAAVRSYRTISTLPSGFARRLRRIGGVISVALSLGSPPADVIRHRVSVEPGLSSPPRALRLHAATKKSGHPAI